MKKIWMLPTLLLGATGSLLAQEETGNPLVISGYAEVYYQQDFTNPKSNARPGFIYSHNRNNEISLNLGLIKATYETQNARVNLGLRLGSYMNANYAAESGVLKNVYEANIGIKLSKTHHLWLDVGILPSHIGFESAIGADCYTLTRSMMAENSPYFETGAKLSYGTANRQWNMAVFILNGWQRIQRLDGNTTPAFGHQLTFHPSDKVTLNSSSFIGNDFPQDERKMRYFHNLYGQFQISDHFALIAGFDIGIQQKVKDSRKYSTWYTPAVIAKYSPSEKMNLVARGEYYHDKDGVIISSGTTNGFQTLGVSVSIDYQVVPNVVWRTEVKNLRSKDAIFTTQDNMMKDVNTSLITALAFRF